MKECKKCVKLSDKISSLHGKLGVQGGKIHREEKYRAIKVELNNAYENLNKLELERATLRDEFAAKAPFTLQDAIQHIKGREDQTAGHAILTLAELCYSYADAMLKARKSTKQE